MRSGHIGVGWEVSEHTYQNDKLTDGIDKEELCAEPCSDNGVFKAFMFSACGNSECRRILCVKVDGVSLFAFVSTLQLFHG